MLRVGLTGELGSGKSTVARRLAAHGALVLSSDEMGRGMMQQGESVYQEIVERFGPGVLLPDGQLNRPELARLAFDPIKPQVEALNAIVHPAVLAEQERQVAAIARSQPQAIVVIESALIFTTRHAGTKEPWRDRFDLIVCVRAPDEVKVQRYAARMASGRSLSEVQLAELQAEAARRLAAQRIAPRDESSCFPIENGGDLLALEAQVDALWARLQDLAAHHVPVT